MKQVKLIFLLTVLMSMVGAKALAYVTYPIDGIYYDFSDGQASVTFLSSSLQSNANAYSGNIVIPQTVSFNGRSYIVTSIGEDAFHGCTGLTSITIPNSVTSIGFSSFSGCTGLTSVTIPNSVTSIGSYAFQGCTCLTSISIPNSVTSIGENAFLSSGWYNNQPDGLVYAGNVAYKYKGTMPSNTSITLREGTVGIATDAFHGCTGLTSVTIPNSVTSIGSGAFAGCTGLTNITIPNSVTSIGENAFLSSGWYNNQPDGMVYAGRVACCYKGTMPSNTSITLREGTVGIADDTFSCCSGLTSVTIPNSVSTIGTNAFFRCSGLTSVTIPNSVTTIGGYAFQGCTGLTDVTIPNSVTNIGRYVFNNCTGLKSVSIPNSVTTIGGYAFQGCTGLTDVTIPNSVTSIGDQAFYECSGLTSVTIPSSVKGIYENAFNRCTALTKVNITDIAAWCNIYFETESSNPLRLSKHLYMNNVEIQDLIIPNSVTTFGNAFSGCTGITSVTLGNSVTSIDNGAFSGCTGLTSIDIPNSVMSIGDYAFSGCIGLTSVTIPNSVTSVGSYAFKGCTGLTDVTIPNSVPSIGVYAFSGCTGLTSIDIPNSVTSIGYAAFSGCTSLTSVTIPNSVTSIGSYVFSGCTSLTSVTFPNSVTSIGECAFYECSGLTSVIIPNSVTSIGNYAFGNCTGLTSVTIPSTVTGVGQNQFSGCSALTCINVSVIDMSAFCNNRLLSGEKPIRLIDREGNEIKDFVIPNNVNSIGSSAFYNCTGLTSVTIPNSVTSIGNWAFYNCSGLTSVTIPNSVTTIGNSAFKKCTGLTSITIPNSVTAIGEEVFGDCTSLTSITIPNSMTAIGTATFSHCTGLTSITIPNSVTSIGNRAFEGCTGLTSITIPNSVTSIFRSAFSDCSSLTSVTIPNSVTSIGSYSFFGCTSLTSVTVMMETPITIDGWAFPNRTNATLYVPAGCKAAYEAAEKWKDFKEIIELVPETPTTVEVTDISQLDNIIYIEPMEEMCGSQATISLKMKNSAAIRGFQFDLYLPTGVTVVKSSKGKIQGFLSAGRLPDEDEHTLTFSEQPDGAIRFLCSSQYEETFTGNDGEIATLKVNIADNMEDGEYPLQLKAMKLTENNIANYYETALVQSKLTISSYVLGDISGDGVVDVSDYTGVANHIHGNTPDGFNAKAADVDENNTIDVSDYTGIANIIHTGSIYGNSSSAHEMMLSPRRVNTDLSTYDNVMYISPFTASAGTQTVLSIKMKNTVAIRGFQFDLYLPEGMTVVKSNKGRIQGALSAGRLPDEDEHELTFSEQPDGAIRFLCSSQYDETFTGNDGEIATLQVNIAGTMANGDYPILMKAMKLTETDISKFYTADLIETTVTIGETDTRTVLDENDTTAPANATNVDVRVRRKIKANEWSTLVLPFDMTEAQVKTAFGDDVQLAEFGGWAVTEWNANDEATAIQVTFNNVSAITANTPYVIKVSQAMSEFTVDGVDIDVDDEPCVTVGKMGKGTFGSFTGSYVPVTIDDECLFLSDNKFWYSVGNTNMKGFRCYFYFQEVLASYSSGSGAKIGFTVDETNEIYNLTIDNLQFNADAWYSLEGVKLNKKPTKAGVYLHGGKKVVVK